MELTRRQFAPVRGCRKYIAVRTVRLSTFPSRCSSWRGSRPGDLCARSRGCDLEWDWFLVGRREQ